jgi:hypothetical protein
MSTIGLNWADATATTANKLIDSGADFVSAGITEGMIVAHRNLTDYAIVTAVDSATQLSLSKDIFLSGNPYSIMKGFVEGDEIEIGTAILDGTQGDVMTEVPLHYFKAEFSGDSVNWGISLKPKSGYIPQWAFVRDDGSLRDAVYVSSFEGVIDDRGFANGTVLTAYNLVTAKLRSLPGMYPVPNGQRGEFRTVSANNGLGYHQYDQAILFMLQLLYIDEFRNLNSQSAIGNGLTTWTSGERDDFVLNTNNRAVNHTGYSLTNGNNTVNSNTNAGNASGYMTYRGIENWYGNIWKWTDGININDRRVYLKVNPPYVDDTSGSGYTDTTFTQPASNGFISKIHPSDKGLLVREAAGSATTFMCDQYFQSTGWRVVRAGGSVPTGDTAGFAALLANDSASSRNSAAGSRVCFRF